MKAPAGSAHAMTVGGFITATGKALTAVSNTSTNGTTTMLAIMAVITNIPFLNLVAYGCCCGGVMVGGLARGKDIWGRVRAIGPNNTASGWSDPATVMVA